MALPDGVLDAVKNYLDITWPTSQEEDAKLTGIIERGMSFLDTVVDKSLDYSLEETPRELLFEYVRYTRLNALHEFITDHLARITHLQITSLGEEEVI